MTKEKRNNANAATLSDTNVELMLRRQTGSQIKNKTKIR